MTKRYVFAVLLAALAISRLKAGAAYGDPGTGDWPMWAGWTYRNNTPEGTNIADEWDVDSGDKILWSAPLGSQTYGNPVVANGKVFVGTNNELLRDPKQTGDRGVLMAFRESDGEFLWQQTHEKLASGRANDWPFQGVASSPLVEGTRVYYTSNRGVVWCLDVNGFRDGKNEGPVTDEKLTGMNDADSTPSPSRFCKKFGMRSAARNAPAAGRLPR